MPLNDDVRRSIIIALQQQGEATNEEIKAKIAEAEAALREIAARLDSRSPLKVQPDYEALASFRERQAEMAMLLNNIPIVLRAMGATPEILALLRRPIDAAPEPAGDKVIAISKAAPDAQHGLGHIENNPEAPKGGSD